jgi:hypothetical protein
MLARSFANKNLAGLSVFKFQKNSKNFNIPKMIRIMPERMDGNFLLKFFIQLLRSAENNIRTVLARITATIIHKTGISKKG